jgi:hypothetical protein
MADKKVERSRRERPLTPTQKMKASLSDQGTMNMADTAHDKGKSALFDKFRAREARWRREQALSDQEAAQGAEKSRLKTTEAGETGEPESPNEGGAQ